MAKNLAPKKQAVRWNMLGAVLANRGFPEQAIEVWRHALQLLGRSGEGSPTVDGWMEEIPRPTAWNGAKTSLK